MKFTYSIFFKLLTVSFFSFFCSWASSQNQFKSLNSDNGLPSNNINNIFQDSKGYVWIGTDNGLCRWDSKNFKTYTIADGLPNNEVYDIAEDSEGKIWFSTFSTELCYYKNDTIFNPKNDKRLKNIKIIKAGNLVLNKNYMYFLNYKSNFLNKLNIENIDFKENINENKKIKGWNFLFFKDSLYNYTNYKFENYISQEIFFNNHNFVFIGWYIEVVNDSLLKILDYNKKTCYLVKIKTLSNFLYKYSKNFNSIELYKILKIKNPINNSPIIINDSNSYIIYQSKFENGFKNFFKIGNDYYHVYNKKIVNSTVIMDLNFEIYYAKEINKILYLYTSKGLKIFNQIIVKPIFNSNIIENNIHKFFKYINNFLYLDNNESINLKNNLKTKIKVNSKLYNISNNQNHIPSIVSSNKIVNLLNNKKVDSDSFNSINKYFKGFFYSNKFKIYIINNGTNGFYKQTLKNEIKKISPRTAYTSFIDSKNRLWLGSVSNLYISFNFIDSVKDDKEVILNKNFDLFCSEIQEDSLGNIFFTSNDGIYIIDKNNFKYHLNQLNLLSSNECKTLKIDPIHHSIYVATTNGLNQIKYTIVNNKLHFEVINKFFKSDGLSSNEIKDILIDGDSILVATPNGLDLISNTQYRPDTTFIPIYYNSIFVNDSQINYNKTSILLTHNQNNIKVDFSAIYYSRRDRLEIIYKLVNGRDTAIGKIKDNNLQFLSLQPGNYKLQIFAYDKDYPYINGYSKVMEFVIKKPFYSTWWFFILIFISSLLVVNSILRYRNKLKYNQLKTESELNKFRLKGLQNQMNPHFIFNSMSTIQNFIINKKDEHALNFISDFSSLMRNMLDNSRNDSISLENELEFLNQYIQLELIRFEHKFEVNIENKIDEIDLEELYIPTMMIQPLVENAIKHGVSNLNEKKGKIQIEFTIDKSLKYLKVVIQDNGYGFNSDKNKKYKSSAIAILEERLQLYNKSSNFGTYEIVYSKEGTTCFLTLPI